MNFSKSSDMILIAFAMGILFILFIPIPAGLLDLLLIVNFSWGLTILLLTFYTDKPLSFSTFPALLLISTLFRLALNVSATRLILADGDAGRVIQAIGQYVIQGNYVMGLVVFIILIIVQFIVVTNGSQRVAEVAARFTLDSMPGKQMSIDADLNIGIISQLEAQARRSQIEKEANFYGAMDGASKFVKGDAIAGILIMLADILGGFAIGVLQKGLSLGQSIQTYTLLTVGDGLVTQIPALIISTATGIIVTRAATDAHLGSEVAKQIGAYPKSLIMVCLGLVCLLFLKGIPAMPVLLILSLFGLMSLFAFKNTKEVISDEKPNLYEKIRIYPLELHLNKELYKALVIKEKELMKALDALRETMALEFGLLFPKLILKEDLKLNYPSFYMAIGGNPLSQHLLYMDKNLALSSSKSKELTVGIKVKDPTYGLPALWIDNSEKELAIKAAYTIQEPLVVLITHIKEVIKSHLPELLTREEAEKLLLQPDVKRLSEELIPSCLSLSQVQRILQHLLQEKVSIRPLSKILEILLEQAKSTTDPFLLTEWVRAGLALPICQNLVGSENKLQVLTLDSSLEQQLSQQLANQQYFALEPNLTKHFISDLADKVGTMLMANKRPVLLCSTILRRPIKQLTQRVIPHLTVLGMNEIPFSIEVESFAVVK